MVTIIDYKTRQNLEGKDFFVLILLGAIEFVKSQITGQFYATGWKASITSTFTEEVCKSLVGTKVPGLVEKVEVDEPYDYILPNTGETIQLSHKYRFNPSPNNATMEETIFSPEMEATPV